MAKIVVTGDRAVVIDGLKYPGAAEYNVADTYENKIIAEALVGASLITITENFTATAPKGVMPNQPDSVANDVATLTNDFNALLDKLKDAGLMVADT